MALPLPFKADQLVVVSLRDPKERLWGRLLGLEAAGIAIRGLDLSPWDQVLSLVRQGEPEQVALGTRFVPMHRVENLYLDEASCGLCSLGETFRARTGLDPFDFLADPEA